MQQDYYGGYEWNSKWQHEGKWSWEADQHNSWKSDNKYNHAVRFRSVIATCPRVPLKIKKVVKVVTK